MTRPSHCPTPRTIATGEQECGSCGRIWDEDEQPPTCDKRAVVGPGEYATGKLKPKYRYPKYKT